MRILKEIQKMSREEKIAHLRGITSDSIIGALLAYLPELFPSDRKKLHTAILKLKEEEEYQDLLKDFEAVFAPSFSYSPLLERILKRLQIGRYLKTFGPDFIVFQITKEVKDAILKENEEKFTPTQRVKLEKMARALRAELI